MSVIGEGVLEQMTFSIKWKIEHCFADCKNAGDFHESATFPIRYANQITHWHLRVYPRGYQWYHDSVDTERDNSVFSFLYYESENVPEVTVDLKFSISFQVKDKSLQWGKNTRTFKFVGPEDNWGFLCRDVLEEGVLVNDTVTVLCQITFHDIDQNDKKRITEYEKLLDNIGKGFENYEALLESNYYTDVTFNIQDKNICLHKAILMCQNSVFKAMFEHEMKENKESKVDITDIDFPVMKELFRFIYSGKVEDIEKIAKDLLIAADKYGVTELKAMCEKTLYHSLTSDNAIEYLKLTEKCDTIQLKKLVMEFVVDNVKDIVQKSDFNLLFADLDREVVCEIMKSVAEKI